MAPVNKHPLSPDHPSPSTLPDAKLSGRQSKKHENPDTLIALFKSLFFETYHTVLDYGGEDPLYLPARDGAPHRILFAHGFFQSALHEIAHWCVAGPERRRLEDYGYWYKPDGRSASEQAQFFQVEIKPQALEWLFTTACKRRFYMSIDNLGNQVSPEDVVSFERAILSKALDYRCHGLPLRAQTFFNALCEEFKSETYVEAYWKKAATTLL